jgi:hypothetical protein
LLWKASEIIAGEKWERQVNIINHFLRYLGNRDFVSCITFNSKIEILAKSPRKQLESKKNEKKKI